MGREGGQTLSQGATGGRGYRAKGGRVRDIERLVGRAASGEGVNREALEEGDILRTLALDAP